MLNVYCTNHQHNIQVSYAFARGISGANIVPPYPLRPGEVFMYGCLRGLLPTLRQAQREGRTWYYGDNGYFKRGHYSGYYRVTRNAMQHDGRGEGRHDRWERLNIPILPWRRIGTHIVVCPPSRLFGSLMGFDADQWTRSTVKKLSAHTKRPIVVRSKMSWVEVKAESKPLIEDLRDAWALVTHSSNAAVEAVIAGIPVFCTDPCAAQSMGLSDLALIEKPIMPEDRKRWASVLASNQWTLDEMRDGTCWNHLNENRQVYSAV